MQHRWCLWEEVGAAQNQDHQESLQCLCENVKGQKALDSREEGKRERERKEQNKHKRTRNSRGNPKVIGGMRYYAADHIIPNDCTSWKTCARAEEKSEKEGAVQRNCDIVTLTPP